MKIMAKILLLGTVAALAYLAHDGKIVAIIAAFHFAGLLP
jgi:hypothetical protein